MQRIAILYDASQAILSTLELDEVLSAILSIVCDYFHLEHVALLLLDPEKQELYLRSHSGWVKDPDTRVPLGKGITGTAARLKRPIYVADVTQDSRYLMIIESTRSEVAIPLMVRDEVVGVLDCQSDKPNYFDTEAIDLLTLFSTQASIALQNANLYALERRKAAQLEAINAIAKQTTAVLDLRALLDKLCKLIAQSFNVEQVAIVLSESEGLVLRAQHGSLTPNFEEGWVLPSGHGLVSRVIESGGAVVEHDVSAVPGYVAGYKEARSEMCLPLISFGQTLGVLVLDRTRMKSFVPADVQPLESVADICANAIQTARNFERVNQLATLDGLTGIYNRRQFEKRILEEMERAQRYEIPLSVLMVDIDHFKRLNDEYGHLLGDEVLRQVSAIFTQHMRKPDVLCRYGGEEFAILAPETPGSSAVILGDKLRRMIETWPFPGVASPVTISIGVADFPGDGRTRDELVKAADSALYAAKQAGRNRVLAAAALRSAFR